MYCFPHCYHLSAFAFPEPTSRHFEHKTLFRLPRVGGDSSNNLWISSLVQHCSIIGRPLLRLYYSVEDCNQVPDEGQTVQQPKRDNSNKQNEDNFQILNNANINIRR